MKIKYNRAKHIYLNNEDVSDKIRGYKVSINVSSYAKKSEIRNLDKDDLGEKNKIELKPIIFFNFAILFQVILGIVTLITGVKIYYASLHQLGSILVLTSFIFIYYKNIN